MDVAEVPSPDLGDCPRPSSEVLRRLGESAVLSPLGLGLCDADGRIEWINSAFLARTGYRAAELIGKHPLDLFRGRVAEVGLIEALRARVDRGEHVMAEFQVQARTGRPYWSQFRMGPGAGGSRLPYCVFSEEDITDRRRVAREAKNVARRIEKFASDLRAERELLANVLATIPHYVFWKDTSHRYLGCNEAYARLRGISSENLAGRPEAELGESPLGSLIADIEGQVLETGVPVIDHTVVLECAEGRQRVMLSILPRYANGGAPGGVIGVGTDVTRITELERQLAQATRLESIGQLAAGLAHEINTPVQYVSDNTLFLADSFTDVLEALRSIANVARGPEPDPRAGGQPVTVEDLRERLRLMVDDLDLDFLSTEIPTALEQTLEGVGRVAEIVRAMKEFSHPGQGRVDMDLNRAVETTVQVSRSEWKYVAAMDLDLDAAVGLVPCYEGELKQVVLNLVVNAAHAIAEAHEKAGVTELGRIGIQTRRDGDTIRLSISDDGAGMTSETKTRIFDPFFTTKGVGKGTGQGLAMAHSCIVGKHGGSIDVTSEVGVGTTFWLNLPATAAKDVLAGELR